MRAINTDVIIKEVARAVVDANICLPQSVCARINECAAQETDSTACSVFADMLKNIDTAKSFGIPVCQDTGMAVIFVEIGQEVCITGGGFESAINEGVALGYTQGYLRKSVVADPLRRVNTENNTPAIIHTRIVQGDKLKLTISPKGFGSENMSAIKMLNPTADKNTIVEFVTHTVRNAGARPCPPLVIGIGLGGDFEYAALLSKKALCRDVDVRNSDPFYAALEADILAAVNALNIGAQGFGGDITALAVNIEAYPTHIAGLPLAVNIGCHVTRHVGILI